MNQNNITKLVTDNPDDETPRPTPLNSKTVEPILIKRVIPRMGNLTVSHETHNDTQLTLTRLVAKEQPLLQAAVTKLNTMIPQKKTGLTLDASTSVTSLGEIKGSTCKNNQVSNTQTGYYIRDAGTTVNTNVFRRFKNDISGSRQKTQVPKQNRQQTIRTLGNNDLDLSEKFKSVRTTDLMTSNGLAKVMAKREKTRVIEDDKIVSPIAAPQIKAKRESQKDARKAFFAQQRKQKVVVDETQMTLPIMRAVNKNELSQISLELRKEVDEAEKKFKAAKKAAHEQRLKEHAERAEKKKQIHSQRLAAKKQPLLQAAVTSITNMTSTKNSGLTNVDNSELALAQPKGSTCGNKQDIEIAHGHLQMGFYEEFLLKKPVEKKEPFKFDISKPITGDLYTDQHRFDEEYKKMADREKELYLFSGVRLHAQLALAYLTECTESLARYPHLPDDHPFIVWIIEEMRRNPLGSAGFIPTPYPGFKFEDGTIASGIHAPRTVPTKRELTQHVAEELALEEMDVDEVDTIPQEFEPVMATVEEEETLEDVHTPSEVHLLAHLELALSDEHHEALNEDYAVVRMGRAPIIVNGEAFDSAPVNIVSAILKGKGLEVPRDLAEQYLDSLGQVDEVVKTKHGLTTCDHEFLMEFILEHAPDTSVTIMRKKDVLDSTRNEMRIVTQFVVVVKKGTFYLYLAKRYTPTLDNAEQLPPVLSKYQTVQGKLIGACSRDATETILRHAGRPDLVPQLYDVWRQSIDDFTLRVGGASRNVVFTMIQLLNTHGITAAYVQGLGEKAACHTYKNRYDQVVALKDWTGYLMHCAYNHAMAMKVGIANALPTLPKDARELPYISNMPLVMFKDENGRVRMNYTCLLDACKAICEHASIPNFDLTTFYRSILTSVDSPLSSWGTALKMIQKLEPIVGPINLVLKFGCFWNMKGFPMPYTSYPSGYSLHVQDNHCVAVYRPAKPISKMVKALKWVILTLLTMTSIKMITGLTTDLPTHGPQICSINGSTSDDRYYGELQMDEEPLPTLSMPNSVNQSTSSTQGSTTRFVDANVVRDTENDVNSTDADNLDYLHSIQTILARPTLITEVTLNKSTPALTLFGPQQPIVSVSIPADVMNKGNKMAKISNFAYFRATTVVKVMVNANPFTSGKLWVCMAPMDADLIPIAAIANKSKVAVTSYPGVELDLQVNKNVEMEVPWTYPEESRHPWSPLNSTKLNVYAMSPLQGPAGFTVNMQVFGWLKNVILRGPTVEVASGELQMDKENDTEPQTSDVLKEISTTLTVLSDVLKMEKQGAKISQLMINNTYHSVVKSRNSMCTLRESIPKGHLQMEDPEIEPVTDEHRRSLNQMDQEMPQSKKFTIPPVAREAKGPIARVAGHISRVASAASHFPVISTVTKPIQWVADIVGAVANIFGWSRPVEGSGAPAVTMIPGRGMAQTTCSDQAVVLGYSNLNELSTNDTIFLRKEDEMETEFISARPGLVDVVAYNTTSTGALVGELVGAQTDPQRTQVIAGETMRTFKFAPTCFEYLAHMTSHWRADIHFRVSVAKTAFHTGRLEIVFVPGLGTLPPNFDATNCYRAILDLSRQNEMEFVVPFVSQFEMQEVTMYSNSKGANGRVFVRALTPLLCPDNVAQTVDIFIWKWASNVALAGTAQSTPGYIPAVQGHLEMDVGIDSKVDKFVCYGKQTTRKQNIEVAQRVCGELLTNARLLTRAHRLLKPAVGKTTLLSEIRSDNDYLGYLGSMFAYFRGGLSYKLVAKTPEAFKMTTALNRSLPTDPFPSNSTFHVTDAAQNFVHEVMLPYYAKTRKLVNNQNLSPLESRSRLAAVDVTTEGDAAYDIYRAGKDDFSMGCLIGPARYTYVYDTANPGLPWTLATLPTTPDDYQKNTIELWKQYWTQLVSPPNPAMAANVVAMTLEVNAFLLETYGVPGGILHPYLEYMDLWFKWLQAHHPSV
uniref:Structural polyprotein n=1 Tax=Soybean thrips picorna-like virus 11 TaxID=2796572 RepID=A0A7T3R0L0_9VIRU|nr:structural polyprotein [Soybean thrips picorna-like virus 11]